MRPRVIVADYYLAGEDRGTQAVAAVRAQCGGFIPALLMSSDRAPQMRVVAREAGLLLLPKPIAPSKLRAALTHLFAQAARSDHAA
jgi:CheY-like chemotaxis protein